MSLLARHLGQPQQATVSPRQAQPESSRSEVAVDEHTLAATHLRIESIGAKERCRGASVEEVIPTASGGWPWAWTMSQRYVSLAKLRRRGTTTTSEVDRP